MNCCDCQAQLADLSAEALASDQAQAMREHFEQCSHCYEERVVFERTLFLVSSCQQPLPSPLATEQMWHRCSEHIFNKVEAERLKGAQSEYSDSTLRRGWFARQPRWSWASLAAAFALLGAVWAMSPRNVLPGSENLPPEGQLVSVQNPNLASLNLRNPPTMAAGLVTHHAAMTLDPFTDYVGTNLVAASATPPTVNSAVTSRR